MNYELIEKRCLKVVASWAFGINIELIEARYDEFSVLDLVKLGLERNYYCGSLFNELDITNKKVLCQNEIQGTNALVIIKNKNNEGSHALYWTGERLLDPEGGGYEEELEGIRNKLISWMPIINVTENLGE